MFLLVCEASMGLTKSSHARTCTQHTHTHIHTHTHTCTIMLVWHLFEGTGHSMKPHPDHHENPGVLLSSTKKKLAARWHGNHELMSPVLPYTQRMPTLPALAFRRWDLHQVWSVDLMFCFFSESFSCVSQWTEWNDAVVGGVYCRPCSVFGVW